MIAKWLIGLAAFVPALAWGQASVRQNGAVTPGDLARWRQDHLIETVGQNPVNPITVQETDGKGVCTISGPASGPHYSLCMTHDAAGNALFNIEALNGAPDQGCKLRLNGASFECIGGPTPSYRAPTRVYVATTGSDSNECSLALPCATLQHALAAGTAMLNTSGESLYITMAPGTYNQSFFVNGPLTGMVNSDPNPNGTNQQAGQVVVEGAGSATTTLNGGGYCGTIISSNYANVAVRALKINGNSNACQSTLFGQMYGTIHLLDDLDFGAATIEHIHLENAAQIQAWFSYKVSGGALRHITSAQSSMYLHSAYPSGNISFVGTPSFPYQFAWATQQGTIQWNQNTTWTGTFTGIRYAATAGGNIQTPSTSYTWIPGSVAGYAASGGTYTGAAPAVFTGAVRADGQGGYSQASCTDIQYQECDGTDWTPALQFNGGSTGMTYTSRVGKYFRNNKLIIATFDIVLSAKGSSTGSAGIAGLPFPSFGSGILSSCTIAFYGGMANIAGFMPYINSGASVISLTTPGTATNSNYTDTNFTNASRISGSCTYVAA